MTTIIAEKILGSTCVRVIAVSAAAPYAWSPAGLLSAPGRVRLEVWYRPDSRTPRIGETIDTRYDVSTLYAVAPLR